MKFKTKNESDFFNTLDEICIRNNMHGTSQKALHYDSSIGFIIIDIGNQFIFRLKEKSEADYQLLLSLYGYEIPM